MTKIPISSIAGICLVDRLILKGFKIPQIHGLGLGGRGYFKDPQLGFSISKCTEVSDDSPII
jgi:hypothetical protein